MACRLRTSGKWWSFSRIKLSPSLTQSRLGVAQSHTKDGKRNWVRSKSLGSCGELAQELQVSVRILSISVINSTLSIRTKTRGFFASTLPPARMAEIRSSAARVKAWRGPSFNPAVVRAHWVDTVPNLDFLTPPFRPVSLFPVVLGLLRSPWFDCDRVCYAWLPRGKLVETYLRVAGPQRPREPSQRRARPSRFAWGGHGHHNLVAVYLAQKMLSSREWARGKFITLKRVRVRRIGSSRTHGSMFEVRGWA